MTVSRSVAGMALALGLFWTAVPHGSQATPPPAPQTPRAPLRDAFYNITAPQPVELVAPFQIFDNLYYIGTNDAAAYLITTSDGLIMIDTLYDQFVDHLVPAIQELGFKPQDIKYAVLSHSHFDHWGGASMLQTRYRTRIAMGAADWDVLDQTEATPTRTPPRRDIVIKDGDTLTLGDTTLKLYWTPGHAPGTTSIEFPVYDRGRRYKAFFHGGYRFGGDNIRTGIASLERTLATVSDVDVNLYCHQWSAAVLQRGEQLKRRKPGDPHPFVVPGEFETLMRFRLAEARTALENASRRPGPN